MDYKKEFERMMNTQTEIALATVIDGTPNVRIVNFYYEAESGKVYFASFGDNQKVAEIEKNPQVAFTTITTHGEEHVRVKNGIACKSTTSIEEIKGRFLEKIPQYIMSIPEVLPALVLFEICFHQADVVLDFEHMGSIRL